VAYDEKLADRVRDIFAGDPALSERKMFGGLAFMLDGNMCCGIVDDRLMLRLGADLAEQALERTHVHRMDFTGRPMTGMVYVAPEGARRSTPTLGGTGSGLRANASAETRLTWRARPRLTCSLISISRSVETRGSP
jgi:TfoX/Sxy family transcriptional regulator of competence genes